VRSPVRGTIKTLKIATIGGVIQPGADLAEIVPLEDTLLVEAQVRPADIAFLAPGLPAMVKITAYDFSIYGGLAGVVEDISADTIVNERDESVYRVRVRTDRNYLGAEAQPLRIIPGMTAQVDVLTGEKTVLDYLLKPILRARSRALTER
jgi:adhesin transport system membrane fusion protein